MSRLAKVNKAKEIHANQPWFVLCALTHYDLVFSVDPSISHFYSFEADQSRDLTFAVPDGCVDIVFDCNPTHPSARVCGTTLEARSANLDHKHRYFGVRFAQGVSPNFSNLCPDQLVDQEIDLADLLPHADALIEQILSASSCFGQALLFKNYFKGNIVRPPSSLTAHAIHLIRQNNGNVRNHELESETGYSRRTIYRQLINDIGLSPKALSRIVRCQSAIYNINHHQQLAFADLASDLGFSDQSHFLREFKKFVNATPVDYRSRVNSDAYSNRIRYF